MKNYFKYMYFSFLFLSVFEMSGQEFHLLGNRETETIRFEMINNLIIVPIEVNGVELTFIVDSGVGTPVIFNLKSSDTLGIMDIKNVKLRGLGEGDSVDAFHSKGNRIQLGNILNLDQDVYIIYNEKLDLSTKLGIPVNGIIGYDLLKDFIVTINYIARTIKFTKPENYVYKNCSKCETFELYFHKNKPYVNGEIVVGNSKHQSISVQLLIDSGSADSLWLFEDNEKGIYIPENSFEDFIGEGISGSIFGMRSKINKFSLKSFELLNPNVAYLDANSTAYAKSLNSRSGSLGGDILKRFKVILDYQNSKMTLKKNRNFKNEFSYNMSGIELIYAGKVMVKELSKTTFNLAEESQAFSQSKKLSFDFRYEFSLKPMYEIAYIRAGSPGEEAGLLVGDLLTEIDGKSTYNYELQEVIGSFYYKEEKSIKLTVDRDGMTLEFELRLLDLLGKPNL